MAGTVRITRGQLRSIIREEARRLTEGSVETCPYCGHEFGADQGDYMTPGRVQCPECGGDFDAMHDDAYVDDEDPGMALGEPTGALPCPDCGAEDTHEEADGSLYCRHCDKAFSA